jgi:hypothetical protein
MSAWENWKKPQIPKLRRRWKQNTPQDGLRSTVNNASLEKKIYPPVSISRYRGKESEDRGRPLEKAASDASLKHHARRNSLPDSVRSKKVSRDNSSTGKERGKRSVTKK